MRTFAALLLGVTMLGGCAGDASDATAAKACEFGSIVFATGPAICAQAVARAQESLGWLHFPVTSIEFRTDMCPPNARCAALDGDVEGWVVFMFSIGDPAMVHVHLALVDGADVVVADAPQPVPDWLRDELLQGPAPDSGNGSG